MNLIPTQPGETPSYWCTWNAQHPMWRLKTNEELERFDFYAATEGGNAPRASMNQHALFTDPGWATNFWPAIRSDLYLCLDDGWDVPATVTAEKERWKFGSLILNRERFPDFGGKPAERLRRLNERVKSLGWKGVALWVAAQCEGDGCDGFETDEKTCEAYWRERVRWSAEAGIDYWKVDWGHRCHSASFRRLLTEIARQDAPRLLVEHARCMSPLNNIGGDGHFKSWQGVFAESLQILNSSDAFRSYDEIESLRIPVAMDRITALASEARLKAPAKGIINCEDNVYLGAALGCALGIMRVPVKNPWTGWQWPNVDEAVRAIRWQRISPAFGLAEAGIHADETLLTDNARVPQDHWFKEAAGREVRQYAPARVSRGMALPCVQADGAAPFVIASRNPSGATSIATLPRCRDGKLETPAAHVEVSIDDDRCPVGVFGKYRSLTLRLNRKPGPLRLWAQDMMAETAQDITNRVSVAGNNITIEGGIIDEIGLAAKSADDPSEPGLVLKLECEYRS